MATACPDHHNRRRAQARVVCEPRRRWANQRSRRPFSKAGANARTAQFKGVCADLSAAPARPNPNPRTTNPEIRMEREPHPARKVEINAFGCDYHAFLPLARWLLDETRLTSDEMDRTR
jgi:hypothetical protein